MIKYLGSKRRLLPILGDLYSTSGARTALDLFTGTTRVAQDFKRRGATVTAVDLSRYSEVFADCWITTDANEVSATELSDAIDHLNSLEGEAGYFTHTFCVESRFFQPYNGARIDAIRTTLDTDYSTSPLYPILLTALMLAADRVDSTTGVQMAYVKKWSDRSYKNLELRVPDLIEGTGTAIRGDALEVAPTLGSFDLAYLDPPYNQHRYYANYHIWETLVEWDAPEHYGVACKRVDVKDDTTKSRFNEKRNMAAALRSAITSLDVATLILSYNNESWVSKDELIDMCSGFDEIRFLAFDSKRYVGAQIGIFNPSGDRVGEVSHLRNLEWVVVAGEKPTVTAMTADLDGATATAAAEPTPAPS